MEFRVVCLGIPFLPVLEDPAHLMACALCELGHEVTRETAPLDSWDPNAQPFDVGHVLFGLHGPVPEALRERVGARLRKGGKLFVYQTENLLHHQKAGAAAGPGEMERSRYLWDYNARNAQLTGGHYVPLGFVPGAYEWKPTSLEHKTEFSPRVYEKVESERDANTIDLSEPIDVLFAGSLNDRRNVLLRTLAVTGLRTVWVHGVFGKTLEQLQARTRVHLNAHYYEPPLFESARVVPLISRGQCVLSEETADAQASVCGFAVHYDMIPRVANWLVRDAFGRAELISAQRRLFEQDPMVVGVRNALAFAGVS